MNKLWNKFEWDDEDRKNGTSNTCGNMALSLKRLKNVSFTAMLFVRTSDSPMSIFWMVGLTVADVCASFSKTKEMDWHGSSPAGK
jgi:hypothetical protein